MESKALALGKQIKAEALNSNIYQNDLKSMTYNGVQSCSRVGKVFAHLSLNIYGGQTAHPTLMKWLVRNQIYRTFAYLKNIKQFLFYWC